MMPPGGLLDKTYLGDSVYAARETNTLTVWIWTENGFGPNNDAICLDPSVFDSLDDYVSAVCR